MHVLPGIHMYQRNQNIEFKPCMCFSLQLDKLKHISQKEFEQLKWLLVTYRFKQCVSSIVFKYFNEQCPNYLNEVFHLATKRIVQLSSFQKLNVRFERLIMVNILCLTLVPPFRTKHDTLKHSNNLDTCKHKFKKYFLKELKYSNNSF